MTAPDTQAMTEPLRRENRPRRGLPFQNLKRENWLNLALAAVLSFYVFYLVWEIILGTTCGQLGVDFCDYWSAARVANEQGYASVYDLARLYEVEKSIFPVGLDPAHFPVVPFLYLPAFILPFQLLALATPPVALWIWNAVGLTALWLYLRFFAREMGVPRPGARLMLLLCAALPVFLNVFAGQVGVWLVICVGESLRACRDRRPGKAGLWLAGLLIKPQVLILLLLILLLQRSWRILVGFAAGGLAVGSVSVAMVGAQGMAQLLRLWLTYADDEAHIWIEGMMNWRMLGFHTSSLFGPAAGYGLALAGMVATLTLVLRAWRQSFDLSSRGGAVSFLGILAATTVFTWHSQINTAMILIPSLIYLLRVGTLPGRYFDTWVFLPSLVFILIVFAPGLLAALNVRPGDGGRSLFFFFAAGQFSVNFALFWWSMKAASQAE